MVGVTGFEPATSSSRSDSESGSCPLMRRIPPIAVRRRPLVVVACVQQFMQQRAAVLSSRDCCSASAKGGLRGVPVPPASGGAGHVSDIGSAGSATGPARRARGAVVLLVGGTCCAVGGFGVRVPVKPLDVGGTGAPRAFPCPSGVRLVPAGGSLPQPLHHSNHVPP
jgi:hypothetical protein